MKKILIVLVFLVSFTLVACDNGAKEREQRYAAEAYARAAEAEASRAKAENDKKQAELAIIEAKNSETKTIANTIIAVVLIVFGYAGLRLYLKLKYPQEWFLFHK